ncbi:ABC transporter permease [Demequina sp.]|uniref:ABC transporter permease n=1 Tax=Demequina sp. TaxID=2050685 RepID=UPI003D0AB6F9
MNRPSWTSIAIDRTRVEIKEFMRSREQMIFIFAFPVFLLVIFGSIFGGQDVGEGVSFSQYFLAGMIASGIMNTGFQSLALGLSADRDLDILKRLHGTPLPTTAFFAGKFVQVLFVSVVQLAALIALGVIAYDVDLPTTTNAWVTFTWVFLLGTAASVALGIGMSSALRNARAGSAILTPVTLFLQFISGVFIVFTQVPPFLQTVASIFPLKWLAQGMRSVFLPDAFETQEATGSWQHGATALVLAAWFVVGTVWAVRTFRWQRPEDK